MLKIAKRTSARSTERYFLRDSALTDREKVGEWNGTLAHRLQLDPGPITSPQLLMALDDRVPSGPAMGRPLTPQRKHRPGHTVGLDCVVAPHKSISLLALHGPPRIRKAVMALFKNVVRVVPLLLESLTPTRGRLSRQLLLAATFYHTHSRRNDPHLHAHLLFPAISVDSRTGAAYRMDRRFLFRYVRKVTETIQRLLFYGLAHLGLRAVPSVVRSVAAASLPIPSARYSRGSADIDRILMETPPPDGVSELEWRDRINFQQRPRKSRGPSPIPPPSPRVIAACIARAAPPSTYATRALPVYRRLMRV